MTTRFTQIMQHSTRAVAAMTMAAALTSTPVMMAQAAGTKVAGKVLNPAGEAIAKGQIKFTTDTHADYKDEKFSKVVDVKDGAYSVEGVAPGDYLVWLVQNDKTVDRTEVTIKAGEAARTVDFDLSRAEYVAKMTPEERKAIEEYKTKNASVVASNKQVAGLNATLTAVRADLKSPSPNYDKDIADSKAAVDARPNEGVLLVLYGDSVFAKAEHGAKDDRTNKVNPDTDDALKQGYTSAAEAYTKAIDVLNADPKKPAPDMVATVYNELGNTMSRLGKLPEATGYYDKAVATEPKESGTFFANEAAVFFNAHQDDQAVAAADKAIAADPTKPLPYYIKGQELLQKSTVDPKTQKIVPPAGCVDAYQKYLELAPDGPQAPAVRDALAALGEKVTTHYSAKKK
ncbi:MAG: hypothetical protein ACRYFU_06350 [Janthinobacterium lividum]